MFCRTSRLQNFFFLKRSWRCNFLPNKRGRQHSWPCIFPPKKTWFAAQGLSVSFHIAYMEERTYVRTLHGRLDGSDVITKPKFLPVMVYQILLAMGLRSRAPCGARGSSANIFSKDKKCGKMIPKDFFSDLCFVSFVRLLWKFWRRMIKL